jgi:MFS family permease
MEEAIIRISTSLSFGTGFATFFNRSTSGGPYFSYTIAFILPSFSSFYIYFNARTAKQKNIPEIFSVKKDIRKPNGFSFPAAANSPVSDTRHLFMFNRHPHRLKWKYGTVRRVWMIPAQKRKSGDLLKKSSNQGSIRAVLFLGVLMGALDIAIVGPALTPMREAFNIGVRNITWVFSIYVLAYLTATPVLANFADASGRKPVFIASVTIFAVGSAIVALSPDFPAVLMGRAVQGFGAGGIFPAASAVIGDVYPPEKRGRALGLIGAVFGIAFIIGPVLGGVLLLAGWHWIFIVNLPIAAVIVVLAVRILPKTAHEKTGPFDWPGSLLIAAAGGLFVYGINRIDTQNLQNSLLHLWPFFAGAAAGLAGLNRVEKKSKNPLIPPALFSKKQLNITHLLAFGAGIFEALFVFIPAYTLTVFNVSTSASSFMLLPSVAGIVIGSPLLGRTIDKRGAKPVILGGIACLSAGLFLIFFFVQNAAVFYAASFLVGLGLSGLLGAPLRYILLAETGKKMRSSAQGLMSIFTSSGQMTGVAVAGALVASASDPLMGYGSVFLAAAVFALALFAAAAFLKNTRTA